MNKKELIAGIAEETQITKTKAREVLDCTLDSIGVALIDGDDVKLVGFGTFKTTDRAARTARNPATGEAVEVPAQRRVSFIAGKRLKDAVN